MGFMDRFFGGGDARERSAGRVPPEDEQALERYRYLVRTAPPDRLEQAHEEAFAQLTPEQRRLALEALSRDVPDERADGEDPRSLARFATRAELRRPGTVERAFGRTGGGMGVPLFASFATAFAGTLAAQALFADLADGELFDGDGSETADAGGDLGGGDFGGGDFGGGDLGF
jgi:hypothetical protein